MTELQPCPICKGTRICMDGGDNTYHPRCLDCGCTAPFDAWQSRTPAPAEVEELLERYKSSWWMLGYEAASHEDYEISEENWAKMNALKSRLLAALSNTTPYLSRDVSVPVAQDDCIERIISYVDEYINDQIDRVVLKSEIGLVLDDIFYSYLQKGG